MMKRTLLCDTEVYVNFFLASFKCVDTGETWVFERSRRSHFDSDGLRRLLAKNRIVTFNGKNYDEIILVLALSGLTCRELKKVSDQIIQRGLRPWQVYSRHGLTKPNWDHIDLMQVAPSAARKVSLKLYGGMMHSRLMQDLPIEHDAVLTEDQMDVITDYNLNDLEVTGDLWRTMREQVDLRVKMTERYGVDLRSKSDAQIAEAVIKSEVKKITGHEPEVPDFDPNQTFRYKVPDYLDFTTPQLQDILERIREWDFELSDKGKVLEPKFLKAAKVRIGTSVYQMGLGGLHSCEKNVAHYADDDYVLIDRDVTSYYPNIILTLGLYPKHIGKAFLKVYRKIVDERIAAKRAGDSTTADTLKIVVNGSFGKFGSKFSALCSHDLMIQVTLTGQLALLMLIEEMEHNGIQVVSGNTDGIVMRCHKSKLDKLNKIIKWWEQTTGFETEETRYKSVFSRDVNNYIALLEKPKQNKDGSLTYCKTKGTYNKPGVHEKKSPNFPICSQAVIEKLVHGTPISRTIRQCKDPRQFLKVITVTGGAQWRGKYLGKAVRFYYARGGTTIHYKKNGNKVPMSDGCVPMMTMQDELPPNLHYVRYTVMAYDMLADCGYRGPANDPEWEDEF